jgi:hypothetical protein
MMGYPENSVESSMTRPKPTVVYRRYVPPGTTSHWPGKPPSNGARERARRVRQTADVFERRQRCLSELALTVALAGLCDFQPATRRIPFIRKN